MAAPTRQKPVCKSFSRPTRRVARMAGQGTAWHTAWHLLQQHSLLGFKRPGPQSRNPICLISALSHPMFPPPVPPRFQVGACCPKVPAVRCSSASLHRGDAPETLLELHCCPHFSIGIGPPPFFSHLRDVPHQLFPLFVESLSRDSEFWAIVLSSWKHQWKEIDIQTEAP